VALVDGGPQPMRTLRRSTDGRRDRVRDAAEVSCVDGLCGKVGRSAGEMPHARDERACGIHFAAVAGQVPDPVSNGPGEYPDLGKHLGSFGNKELELSRQEAKILASR
jgi:hypothetical protein